MVIKDKFVLLQGLPNVLNLSASVIKSHRVPDGLETMRSILDLMEKRIDHYTKKKVYKALRTKNFIEVVYMPKYRLPVSYNKPTNQIIINLNPFNTREITTLNPTSRDLYGCIVYGICFYELVTKRKIIPDNFAPVISSFLLSVFIRVFGKEYGLVGIYSTQIPKLKYIITCYIYGSFFDLKGDNLFKKSSIATAYDYKQDYDLLKTYDFGNVDDFIKALSELKVFPGISKYNFISKILRFLSITFVPAIEDCSRFISVLTVSNIPGITTSLSPAFYYRYNEVEFDKIMQMSKRIFT